MQVDRARYTPSDIGPSPSDWGAPRLSEVSTLITNGFVGTASPFYSNETGVPYLYGTNVRANKIDLNNLRYITREFHQDQQKTSLCAGDLLTVQSGHIGETAVVPKHLENANCHALIVTRLKPKLVNSDFLCQYINSEIGIARLRGLEVGSTIAHINTKDLKKFRIPLPPLPEQKKIAAILSTWDRAIEGTEKLLANSQQQKKSLMQQLLTGKKRLPGFTGKWKVRKFQDLFQERIETEREDLPLLSVTANDGIIFQEYSGRKDISKEDKSKYKRICVDDIGYNTMRMWQGRSCLSDKEGIVSPAYTIVFAKKNICTAFASYLFKFSPVIHVFYRHSQGLVSDTWNLKFKHFKEISWEIPSLPEQKTIAAVLTTADEEITALESDLSRLRREKKALMQQLLTGKRRVKVD